MAPSIRCNAMEVRHPSFECEDFVSLLREYHVALVVADTAGKWPFIEDATSDFMYLRLHGDEKLYVSGYTEAALKEWARKIRAWRRGTTPSRTRLLTPRPPTLAGGRDIYAFFDNDVKVRAPFDAMNLAYQLGASKTVARGFPDATIDEEPREHWPVWELPFSKRARKNSAPH